MEPDVADPTGAPNILSIQVLGKFELRIDGQPVELNSRKARALLGYLVLNESSEETRERLVGLLWSDSDEERARGSLRQCLREIRMALPPNTFDGFVADRLEISLERDKLDVDLWHVLEHARQGRAHSRLLDGPDLLDDMLLDLQMVDEEFGSWLTAKRQTVKERILRHLETPLRALVQEEDDALQIARVILNLDPTHEEAARKLMRTLAARGDAAGAQRVYKKLWEVLENEFDSRPDEKTQDAIAEIKAAIPYEHGAGPEGMRDVTPGVGGESLPHSANQPASAASLPGKSLIPLAAPRPGTGRSMQGQISDIGAPISFPAFRPNRCDGTKLVIAIAPFEVATTDPNRGYFVQGFRRDLIGCLVRFREWMIREQTTSAADATANIDEYLLEANGVHTGNSIRIVLTLKECGTGGFLWSENLNITLENWQDTQHSVVRRIATALNVHISAGRMSQIGAGGEQNHRAFDRWLLGQAHWLTYEPLGWHKAEELFREIIASHSAFAPAYSSLAQLQNTIHLVHPGILRETDRAEEALNFARQATRIDPMDSRGQLCLGWAHAMSRQHDQATIHHQLACDLNDNDPWTLISAALGFAFSGIRSKASELADHALSLSLNPSPIHWAYQSTIRFMCGDYEECVDAGSRASGIAPALAWTATALHHLGRDDEARNALTSFYDSARSRWFSPEPATPEVISRWFLLSFPIRQPQDWDRLASGLEGAGAPILGVPQPP